VGSDAAGWLGVWVYKLGKGLVTESLYCSWIDFYVILLL